MTANKFFIRQTGFVNKTIDIPVELTWDYLGLDEAIDEYENKIVEDVIGKGRDFEVSRFSHAPSDDENESTEITYEFYFYSGGSLNNINNWSTNYITEGFTTQDIFYFSNNFSNSFFKLDFYDTLDEKRQTNYITIILPTQQGMTMDALMNRTQVKIKKPKFVLDFIGDKDGFFIYWLKKRNFLDISTFYMTAKFFNANTGQFAKMMTGRGWNPNSPTPCSDPWPSQAFQDTTMGPQAFLSCAGNTKPFVFDNAKYFYYTVKLDYITQTYKVFNTNGQRMGTNIPIKWFEYINP